MAKKISLDNVLSVASAQTETVQPDDILKKYGVDPDDILKKYGIEQPEVSASGGVQADLASQKLYLTRPIPQIDPEREHDYPYRPVVPAWNKDPFKEDTQEVIDQYMGGSRNIPSPPEQEMPGLGKRLGGAFAAGSAELGQGFARVPSYVYELFALPQNIIAEKTGAEWLKATPPDWFKNNPIAKYYDKQVKGWTDQMKLDDQEIVSRFQQGDIKGGFENIAISTVRTLPLTISLMAMGFASEGGIAKTLAPITAYAGAQKKHQLDTTRPDLSESQKMLNSILSGTGEALSEQMGTISIAKIGKNLLGMMGKQEFEKRLKNSLMDNLYKRLGNSYVLTGAIGEGTEELVAGISENITDKFTGIDPDKKILDKNLIDQFIVGAVAGGTMTSPVAIASKVQRKVAERQELDRINGFVSEQAQLLTNKQTGQVVFAQDGKGRQFHIIDEIDDVSVAVVDPQTGERSVMAKKDLDITDSLDPDVFAKQIFDQIIQQRSAQNVQQAAEELVEEQTGGLQQGQTVNYKGQNFIIDQVGTDFVVATPVGMDPMENSIEIPIQELKNTSQTPIPQTGPKQSTFMAGKTQLPLEENPDGTFFIPYTDQTTIDKVIKDISSNFDAENFTISPVIEEVPLENVPAFAKIKTQKVAKGISITPKTNEKAVNETAAQTPAGEKPQKTEEGTQVAADQATEKAVKPKKEITALDTALEVLKDSQGLDDFKSQISDTEWAEVNKKYNPEGKLTDQETFQAAIDDVMGEKADSAKQQKQVKKETKPQKQAELSPEENEFLSSNNLRIEPFGTNKDKFAVKRGENDFLAIGDTPQEAIEKARKAVPQKEKAEKEPQKETTPDKTSDKINKIINKKEQGKKKRPNRITAVLSNDPQSLYEAILYYFVAGGKVNSEQIKKHVKGAGTEQRAKIMIYGKKDGPSMDTIYEYFQNTFGAEDLPGFEFQQKVIDAIDDHASIWRMVESMEKLQAGETQDEVVNSTEADTVEKINQDDDAEIKEFPQLANIINVFVEDSGIINWDEIQEKILNDPDYFINSPFWDMSQDEFDELKKIVADENRRKEFEGQEADAGRETQEDQEPDQLRQGPTDEQVEPEDKPKRFEEGKKLSKEEKREVLKTLKDAFKERKAPYMMETRVNQYGKDYEAKVYMSEAYTDQYMVKSDITGRLLRYYITLPDGKIAHPTEIYPDISQSDMKNRQINMELSEREQRQHDKDMQEWMDKNGMKEMIIESFQKAESLGGRITKEYYDNGVLAGTNIRFEDQNGVRSLPWHEYLANRIGNEGEVPGIGNVYTLQFENKTPDWVYSGDVLEIIDYENAKKESIKPAEVQPTAEDVSDPKLIQAGILRSIVEQERKLSNIDNKINEYKADPKKKQELRQAELAKETIQGELESLNIKFDRNILTAPQQDQIRKAVAEYLTKKDILSSRLENQRSERKNKEKSLQQRNELTGDRKAEEDKKSGLQDMFAGQMLFKPTSENLQSALKPFNESIAKTEKELKDLDNLINKQIESIVSGAQQEMSFEQKPAEPAEPAEPIEKLSDFGEKIGGAKKDLGITRTVRDEDSMPAWRRKYSFARPDNVMVIGEKVDTTKPFIVQWAKEVDTWNGKRTTYRPVTAIDTGQTKIFNSEAEAEAYIPIYEAWRQRFRVQKSGDNFVIAKASSTGKMVEYATFPTKEEAEAYMYSTEGATSLLNHKREDFSIPALDKVERTGKDWRQGKDISADEFMNTFGFRGGEFGNWVKPEERRVMLNAAYDSFMDLAELLNVPPRAMSLNGELSIAFGARGGPGAAAHFEPGRAVINLTRMNGAGSLAHEWSHALDNYFGLQGAKKDYSRNEKGEVKAGRVMRTEAGLLSTQGMRKELSDIFDDIVDATQEKSVTRKMGVDEKQKSFDKMKDNVQREVDSLIKRFENGVRRYQYNRKTKKREEVIVKATPEQVAKLKTILDKIISGQGAKPKWDMIPGSKSRWGDYSYISPETLAINELFKDVFGRTGLKRDGDGFYNLGYFADKMYLAKDVLDKAIAGDSETLTVPTEYLKASKVFDRSRSIPYWSSKVELFARAFEYFIQEKLNANKQRADYLQYDKAPVYDAVYGKNPYPVGDERKTLNDLFDKFFNTLQTRKEGDNVIMFKRTSISSGSEMLSRVDARLLDIMMKFHEQGLDIGYDNGVYVTKDGKKTEAPADLEPFREEYDDLMYVKNNTMFKRGGDLGLYSNAEDALTKIKQDKATPEQWKAMILNNGGSQKELDWMDWDGFVNDKKSLTKQEISDFISANKVELFETRLGDNSAYDVEKLPKQLQDAVDGFYQGAIFSENLNAIADHHGYDIEYDNAGEVSMIYKKGNLPAKYYGWRAIEGGENYKEFLLRMPEELKPIEPDYYTIKTHPRPEGEDGYAVFDKRGTVRSMVFDTREQAEQFIDTLKRNFQTQADKIFTHSHWDGITNPVVHVRADERVTPDGKKILLLQEIQSDWQQQGRDKGFKVDTATPEEREEYRKVNEYIDQNNDNYQRIKDITEYIFSQDYKQDDLKYIADATPEFRKERIEAAYKRKINFWNERKDSKLYHGSIERAKRQKDEAIANTDVEFNFGKWDQSYNRWHELSRKIHSPQGVPDMPFKQTDQVVKLALRRMLVYASEKGFDGIAWTTGEQQVEQNKLSRHIDGIIYDQDGSLYASKVNEGNYNHIASNVKPEDLPKYIGKELSEQLLKQTPEGENGSRKLTDLDAKIGGEGMRAFYDQIVPNVVNKEVKKFGVKTDKIDISTWKEGVLRKRYIELKSKLESNWDRLGEISNIFKEDKAAEAEKRQLADEYNRITSENNEIKQEIADIERNVSPDLLRSAKPYDREFVYHIPINDQMRSSALEGFPMFRIRFPFQRPATAGEMLSKTGLSNQQVKYISERLRNLGMRTGAKVNIVDKQSQLPEWIRKQLAPTDVIQGVNIGGVSYIVLENQKSEDEAVRTFLHEIGVHEGIKNLIPDKQARNEFFGRVVDDIGISEISKVVPKEYMDDYNSGKIGKHVIGEEYMAYLAEKKLDPSKELTKKEQSIWERFIETINEVLNKVFGLNAKITEDDVLRIAQAAIQTNFQERQPDTATGRATDNRQDQQGNQDNNTPTPTRPGVRFAGELLKAPINKKILGEVGAWRLDMYEEASVRMNNLVVARKMEDKGENEKTIRLATGWERGADGKWRYETLDGKLKYDKLINSGSIISTHSLGQDVNVDNAPYLDEVWDDKELFTAYPELRKIKFIGAYGNGIVSRQASFGKSGKQNVIKVLTKSKDDFTSAIIHEIQHAIQDEEGFAPGGNLSIGVDLAEREFEKLYDRAIKLSKQWLSIKQMPQTKKYQEISDKYLNDQATYEEFDNAYNDWQSIPELIAHKNASEKFNQDAGMYYDRFIETYGGDTDRYLVDKARSKYMRLAGEVESRNTQIRSSMNPDQRLNTLLSETEDIARKDQIFLRNAVEQYGDFIQEVIDNKPSRDIRFKKSSQPKTPAEKIKKGGMDDLRQIITDSKIAMKRFQEKIVELGGKIANSTDMYNAENHYHGRVLERQRAFEKQYQKPLIDAVVKFKKAGKLSFDEVYLYLQAKHAGEWNDHFRKLYGTEEDYSGLNMTDDQITDKIKEIEDKIKDKAVIENLWDKIRSATNFSIDNWLRYGMMSKEVYDQIKARKWQYYIPLRGWEFDPEQDIFDFDRDIATGFSRPIEAAKGRKSKADNPLPYIFSMANTSIVAGEKNLIKQAAGRLISQNKNILNGIAGYNKVYLVQYIDQNGNKVVEEFDTKPDDAYLQGKGMTIVNNSMYAIRKPRAVDRQREVEFYIRGEKYILRFEDPAVANAINNRVSDVMVMLPVIGKTRLLRADQMQNIPQSNLAQFTRFISSMLTSRNPDFVIANVARDIPLAFLSHYVEGTGMEALQFTKNLARVQRTIVRGIRGKLDMRNKMDKMYQEFIDGGGRTGFVHLKDIDAFRNNIERNIRHMERMDNIGYNIGTAPFRGIRMGMRAIDDLTTWSEDMSRFATYVTARENGKSHFDAIKAAKNVTVNFNKKGQVSGVLGAMYAFFNASMQGMVKYKGLWGKNWKKMAFIHSVLMAQGFMIAMLMDLFGGDDDDKDDQYNNYDKLNEFKKANYLNIPVLNVSIPMPQMFRVWHYFGQLAYDVYTQRKTPDQALLIGLTHIPQDFVPIGGGGFVNDKGEFEARPFIPTAALPVYDWGRNKNFMDMPIYRQPFTREQQEIIADSKQYYDHVNPAIRRFTDSWFKLWGGPETGLKFKHELKDGKLVKKDVPQIGDINPEWIENMFEGYFGGFGRFVNNIYKTGNNIVLTTNDLLENKEFSDALKNIDVNSLPILHRFILKPYGDPVMDRYWDEKRINRAFEQDVKAYEKMGNIDRLNDYFNSVNMEKLKIFEAYQQAIDMYNDAIESQTDKDEIKSLEQDKRNLVKEYLEISDELNKIKQ